MDGIGFKNMKVFKDEHWFDFKKITLLTGTNNSGKSSIINAMQMLQENLQGVKLNSPIDKFARTEFRLVTNQNKYGSISNFVNKKNSENFLDFLGDNSTLPKRKPGFEFSLKKKRIKYNFYIEITEGIESVGRLKSIEAKDVKTNQEIFSLEIINREENNLRCTYKINYKYFVNDFRNKCTNTIKFNKKRKKLDDLLEKVNNGTISINKFENFAKDISSEFSVYIKLDESINSENPNNTYYSYFIYENPFGGEEKVFDETGVLFLKNKNRKIQLGHIPSIQEFESLFLNFYKRGVFKFDVFFNEDIIQKDEFETLICEYYQQDKDKAYYNLSNDLLTIFSNTTWDFSEELPGFLTNTTSLIKDYLLCHTDFGFSTSFLEYTLKNSKGGYDTYNYVRSLYSVQKVIENQNREIKKLSDNGFFNEIYTKLSEFVTTYFFITNNDRPGHLMDEKFYSFSFVDFDVFSLIENDIIDKIVEFNVELNNEFVSSSRFEAKRSYNFNDKSDFTSLLQKIELLNGVAKTNCLSFINKWVKEFEIADSLILKPDIDTGNFKAYLSIKNNYMLLADYGLGTNQLLPVIFSLAIHHYEYNDLETEEMVNRTVVIEEPESNLHPAMQSKLANLFVDAITEFILIIIIETHSEYLIRKLQYLVAKNDSTISSDDILIYYFNKPDHPMVLNNKLSQVMKIHLDKKAILSEEFGTGFFDEVDNIALELFLLRSNQKN